MSIYNFKLTGAMALLMHNDDVMFADEMKKWQSTDEGRTAPNGDDRAPGHRWQGYLYHDGSKVTMPAANLMAALRGGATKIILKKQTTYKQAAMSLLVILGEHCAFSGSKGEIDLLDLAKIRTLPFSEQLEGAKKLGFGLDVRRATIGSSKHVRVRPRFEKWSVSGRIEILDAAVITLAALKAIFEKAGNEGLGDWRPSAKKPGPFGRFTTEVSA